MCLYCPPPFPSMRVARNGPSIRGVLRQVARLGAALPFLGGAFAAERSGPPPEDFRQAVRDLVARANSSELAAYRLFEIEGADLPWLDIDLQATKGQQITFLTIGRMWIARPLDLWFPPGLIFHARTRGLRPIWSPGVDTGTMTAAHDGPLEIARAAAEFSNEDGKLWTPQDEYRKQEVKILGVALLWRGDASAGLANLAAHGDVGGLLAAEIARLKRGRKLPEGWSDHFSLGGGAEVFNRAENGGLRERRLSLDH